MGDLFSLETAMLLCVGIGLSSAAGFRVFLPPLALGIAQRLGLPLTDAAPAWLGGWPALVGLGAASVIEVGAYYVPWLDNLLDTIASPAAVVAGVLLSAAMLTEIDPVWQWSFAVIAGGGAAGVTQGATVVTRGLSTATTGGLANFLLATFEWVASLLFAILALLLAPLAVALFVLVVVWFVRALGRRRARRVAGA